MKKGISILLIFVFYSFLFTQVNFNFEFSFDKIDLDDEFTNIQLFDYNNDGNDEVFVGFNSEEIFRVVCYESTGDTLFTITKNKLDFEEFENMKIFEANSIKYLLTCSNFSGWGNNYENEDIILIRVIDLYSFEELITYNYVTETPWNDYCDFPTINNILTIENQNSTQVLICYNEYWGYGDPIDPSFFDESFIAKFNFENNQLTELENITQSGLEILFREVNNFFISIGFEYDHGGGEWPYSYISYFLKTISNETPAEIQSIYSVDSFYDDLPIQFSIITRNYSGLDSYSNLLYIKSYNSDSGYYIDMKNYSNDLTEILWECSDTETGIGNITASTCVSTNEGDNFVLYFRGYNYEVRNLVTGEIKLSGQSSINPFQILRCSNGELLFFIEDSNSYNVYSIDGEIQVSVDDNLISSMNIDLSNHPNPFNPTTTIEFSIQIDSIIKLAIYNIKGQKIKTLTHNEFTKGNHSIVWNGDDESGKYVSSGIYYYKLDVNGKIEVTNKCLLLK